MRMAAMKDLIFRGTVDEIDVGRLTEGMPVVIKIGALPTRR
jgi:HlyD family secretion protein